jgi:hypothetical protein
VFRPPSGFSFLRGFWRQNPRLAVDVEGRSRMEKPERDAPVTDWSKMLQPLFRCQVPREEKTEDFNESLKITPS